MYFAVLASTVFGERQVSVLDFKSIAQMNRELKQLMASRNNPICFFVTNKSTLNALDEVVGPKNYEYLKKYYTEFKVRNKQQKASRIQCRDITYIEKLPSGMYRLHSEERNLIVPEFELISYHE